MSNLTNNTAELNKILAAVNALPEAGGSGINPTGTIEITENGEHDVTNYATANVNVSEAPAAPAVIEPLDVTENGIYTAPNGVDGYSPVIVNVPSEDLSAEIEAQAALIEEQAGQIVELLTVLDGKAAGGGGSGEYETCTLRVVGAMGELSDPLAEPYVAVIHDILYPRIETRTDENGNPQQVIAWSEEVVNGEYAEIEGVVVGQPLVIAFNVYDEATFPEPVNAEYLAWSYNFNYALFKCTKANDTAVITIVNGV